MSNSFPDKSQGETRTLTFDFSDDLDGDEILSVVAVIVQCLRGGDASPSAMLNGAAVISADQQKVLQSVKGGVNGCDYLFTCRVTTASEVPDLAGTMRVRKAT
jgi:hypothetical protein